MTFYDVKAIRDDVAFIKNDYLQFKEEVRMSFANINAKSSGAFTSDFFPAEDNDSILRFMNDDADFEKRKNGLYLLLLGCGADSQRKFTDSFLRTLFSKNYLATYIWPHGR